MGGYWGQSIRLVLTDTEITWALRGKKKPDYDMEGGAQLLLKWLHRLLREGERLLASVTDISTRKRGLGVDGEN